MLRRSFLGMTALAGVAATPLARLGAKQKRTVRFQVSGFTCPTCAVGLETLLTREPGVTSAQATYPAGVATITYDPARITEATLREQIESMGFHSRTV